MKPEFFKWITLTKKIPVYLVLIISLSCSASWLFYQTKYVNPKEIVKAKTEDCLLPYNISRINDERLMHPLMFADVEEESEELMPLKEKINNYLLAKKESNVLKNASVYFKSFKDEDWFVINPELQYNGASLFKVPFMIALLKEAEDNPELLNKRIYYERPSGEYGPQEILQHNLEPGRYYTLKELLLYAIAYSVNDAAFLVVNNFKFGTLNKFLAVINMKPAELHVEYYAPIEEYSRFFTILFNAGYLNNDMSEYALELMTKSDFNDGMKRRLDKDIVVANKFGERGVGEERELHEFGIVFLKDQPYLLGIMTHGKDYKELKDVLSDISSMVYEEMKKAS